jgi:hypothetical protein
VYAQAKLIDGSDNVNVLLTRHQMPAPLVLRDALSGFEDGVSSMAGLTTPIYAATAISWKEISAALRSTGFKDDASLSVLAVELLPSGEVFDEPLGTNLGKQRILRTSPLVKVPVIC